MQRSGLLSMTCKLKMINQRIWPSAANLMLVFALLTTDASGRTNEATRQPVILSPKAGSVVTLSNAFDEIMSKSFPYKASSILVEAVIGDFSRKTGLPVRIYGSIAKRVDIDNLNGTIGDFLGQLSSRAEIAWWYDGAAYHFELNSDITNQVIETRGYPVERLVERIRELGIVKQPFPFRQSKDGALLYVAGPKQYVGIVGDLARRLVSLRLRRGAGEDIQILPRIYIGGPAIENRKH